MIIMIFLHRTISRNIEKLRKYYQNLILKQYCTGMTSIQTYELFCFFLVFFKIQYNLKNIKRHLHVCPWTSFLISRLDNTEVFLSI